MAKLVCAYLRHDYVTDETINCTVRIEYNNQQNPNKSPGMSDDLSFPLISNFQSPYRSIRWRWRHFWRNSRRLSKLHKSVTMPCFVGAGWRRRRGHSTGPTALFRHSTDRARCLLCLGVCSPYTYIKTYVHMRCRYINPSSNRHVQPLLSAMDAMASLILPDRCA